MWGWTFVAIASWFLWQARRVGLRKAFGQAIFVSLLVPTWAHLGYQSVGGSIRMTGAAVDMRVAIAFLGVIACLVRPRGKLAWRVTAVDLAVAALMSVHVIADWHADGFAVQPVIRAFGEWGLPYLAGRIAIHSADDLRELLPVVLFVVAILTTMAVFEAVIRINPFELAYGPRPKEYMPLDMSRWGVKRAYGPAKHAIFLGVLLLLLMPSTLYAAVLWWQKRVSNWHCVAPAFALLGILATASRAPILGAAIAFATAAFLLWPRTRIPIAAASASALVLICFNFTAVLESMEIWAGERVRARNELYGSDGKVVGVSGTTMRVYLFDVYGEALRRAGLLGFGTADVTGFPVNVPVGPQNVDLLKRVRFVDDVYVLMTLRFGYLGLVAFVGMIATTIVDWSRHSQTYGATSVFAASVAGALLGTALAMITVWMPHDFGFMILWLAGAGSGLRAGTASSGETAALAD